MGEGRAIRFLRVHSFSHAGTMSVYYWPPTTIERQQANAKERAASNWENGGRQLARCNAPAQMQMRARLRHQLQAMEDPDSWDAVSLKGILSMAEWKASVFAAEAETDAVQRGNGGGTKAADASSFRAYSLVPRLRRTERPR